MIQVIGATCLGIVVGYFVKYFLTRIKKFTFQGLIVIGSLIGGGGITSLLENGNAFWYYSIGLLIGIILYIILGLFFGGRPDIIVFRKKDGDGNGN